MVKDPNKVKRGKSSRAKGKAFERKVREELTKQGWIVNRFDNQVDLVNEKILSKDGKIIGKLIQAKNKYNFFTKSYMATGGFPDFLIFRARENVGTYSGQMSFEVQFVECKTNNTLDKLEKQKCEWIEENLKVPCFVAYPEKVGRKVEVKLRRWNE